METARPAAGRPPRQLRQQGPRARLRLGPEFCSEAPAVTAAISSLPSPFAHLKMGSVICLPVKEQHTECNLHSVSG